MRLSLNLAAIARMHAYEFALRFALGGLVTLGTGLVAQCCGPVIGGLFLAFPAILPASVTLVEKHESQKKRRAASDGRRRGREAAAVDAAGAALGGWGLIGFGLIAWRLLPAHETMLVLLLSGLSWLAVAVLLWMLSTLPLLTRLRRRVRRSCMPRRCV
jgi:hypothetical protein